MRTAIRDDRGMVAGRRGITRTEIAEQYGRKLPTVRKWVQDPEWPEAIGRRGRSLEYDPDDVERLVRQKFLPPELPEGEPGELVTVQEAAERAGIEPGTLQSHLSRGTDWPDPVESGDATVKLYPWDQMRKRLMRRRLPRRGDSGTEAEPPS